MNEQIAALRGRRMDGMGGGAPKPAPAPMGPNHEAKPSAPPEIVAINDKLDMIMEKLGIGASPEAPAEATAALPEASLEA